MRELADFSVQKRMETGIRPVRLADYTMPHNGALPSSHTLSLQNIQFSYRKHEALHISRASFHAGRIIAIIGKNGAGKSTFVSVLCGILKNQKGFVYMDETAVPPKKRLAASYMVMQEVNHQLFTESVLDELLLSMPGNDEEQEKQSAEKILENLNLLEFEELHPMSLSGGQKQRVAIGSALTANKSIILFDEPTSGLDYKHMEEVAENFKRLSDQGKTLLIITHDPELLTKCCNYFVFIENGQVCWQNGWCTESKQKLMDFFIQEKTVR